MSKAVHDMFSSISGSYDRGNDLLSLGIHRLWRRSSLFFAGLHGKHPARVLDLCCGTGDYCVALKKHLHRESSIIGLDFVYSMVQLAVPKGKRFSSYVPQGEKAFEVVQGDAMNLPFRESSFDACTIGFGIRNVDDFELCLKKILGVLKSGGTLVVLEFGTPESRIIRPFFLLYSKYIMPFLGGLVSGNKDAYRYLPETSLKFPCGKSFCACMEAAGYKDIKYRTYFGGIAYAYVGKK
jgi:demethylmenaquinone methyltransferase / 2-methoxy-6-polyprenyl-1,4-benzoquinol methylase